MSAGIQPRAISISDTLPDIQPETHIIGLVGIDDNDSDGWFLSDFYLFKHLLAGLGRSQGWYPCLNPAALVMKYREYAHGNLYRERRIVLDQAMLEGGQPQQDIVVVEADRLLTGFCDISIAPAGKLTLHENPFSSSSLAMETKIRMGSRLEGQSRTTFPCCTGAG